MASGDKTFIPIPDIDLFVLLPEYFQVIKDFIYLMNTEQIELEKLWGYVVRVWNNYFIQTADEQTLSQYEDMLGLYPSPTDSLDIRRWRILNRFRQRLPFTLPMLYEILNGLVGLGNYTVDIDYPNYKMTVNFINVDQELIDEAIKTLILLPPAHLDQEYRVQTLQESVATLRVGAAMTTSWSYTLPTT